MSKPSSLVFISFFPSLPSLLIPKFLLGTLGPSLSYFLTFFSEQSLFSSNISLRYNYNSLVVFFYSCIYLPFSSCTHTRTLLLLSFKFRFNKEQVFFTQDRARAMVRRCIARSLWCRFRIEKLTFSLVGDGHVQRMFAKSLSNFRVVLF